MFSSKGESACIHRKPTYNYVQCGHVEEINFYDMGWEFCIVEAGVLAQLINSILQCKLLPERVLEINLRHFKVLFINL